MRRPAARVEESEDRPVLFVEVHLRGRVFRRGSSMVSYLDGGLMTPMECFTFCPLGKWLPRRICLSLPDNGPDSVEKKNFESPLK
jgi:hypothetical protein